MCRDLRRDRVSGQLQLLASAPKWQSRPIPL